MGLSKILNGTCSRHSPAKIVESLQPTSGRIIIELVLFLFCAYLSRVYIGELIVDHCQQTSNDGEKEIFSFYFYSFNPITLSWCPPSFSLYLRHGFRFESEDVEGNRVNTFCFKVLI